MAAARAPTGTAPPRRASTPAPPRGCATRNARLHHATEAEREPGGEAAGERGARQRRPAAVPDEVKRHQGEAARGVAAGKAVSARRPGRRHLQQAHVRRGTAVDGEVVGAMLVGGGLERGHRTGAKRYGEKDIARRPAQSAPGRHPPRQREHAQRAERDERDRILSAAMQHILQEFLLAQRKLLSDGVVEQIVDPAVERGKLEGREHQRRQEQRHAHVPTVETPAVPHHAAGGATAGNRTRTSNPGGGIASMSSSAAPCSSAMRLTIESPRPQPLLPLPGAR